MYCFGPNLLLTICANYNKFKLWKCLKLQHISFIFNNCSFWVNEQNFEGETCWWKYFSVIIVVLQDNIEGYLERKVISIFWKAMKSGNWYVAAITHLVRLRAISTNMKSKGSTCSRLGRSRPGRVYSLVTDGLGILSNIGCVQ